MTAASPVAQLLTAVDASTLRELADLKERQDPRRRAIHKLSPEGLDRLAEILLAGSQPTIGFWRRWGLTDDEGFWS
jgi:hypothetical protein